ncbi:MAG: 4Fe-4S dicluster domain-containing protein [Desulfomonile sp.]|jgi:heterodisulfide reductase subunit C
MQQASVGKSAGKIGIPSGDLVSVINGCFQCSKCSAGCPVASEMDLLPHQMVRLAVMGNVDRIVASKSIWLCLTCHTCGARCPNGIDVPALLDPIRHQMLKQKIGIKGSPVPIFHNIFMQTIKTFGRVHELFLIGMYKMKTKTYFNDMGLGWQMYKKGKIHLLPHRSSHISEVKEIFKQSSLK